MKKFFGFGSPTPSPPPPPSKPPAPPAKSAPAGISSNATQSPAAKTATAEPPSIIGCWKEPGSKETTEFHADGTVTEKTGGGETIRGRYSVHDKRLKLNLDGVRDELSFPISIGPRTLEMTDSDGKITLYERLG